jgi:hypothetical protein
MVPSQSSYAVLLCQSFEKEAIPERREDISEEARLRAALSGVYEYKLHQEPRYEFSSAVLYNQDQFLDTLVPRGHDVFKVVEDVEGAERTLTIMESMRNAASVGPIEILPLDGRQQPLDFRTLEVSASRPTIGYGHDSPPQALQIRISGLNVVDVESATACVWAGGMPGVQFSTPVFPLLQRSEPIRVDLLANPRAEARGLEEHLQAVFGIVFGKSSGRDFKLECCYRYQIMGSGPDVSLPVLQDAIPSNSENLSLTMSSALKKWHQDVAPKKGTFVFQLAVFAANSHQTLPVLNLSELLLPCESIADLK